MEQLWERSEEERKETNSKAEYRNREGTHGKPGGRERGKPKERKRERSTAEATVRRRQEEKGKEEQRLSSQNPKLKRPKGSENSGGQKVDWIAATGRVKVRPREVGSESGRQG